MPFRYGRWSGGPDPLAPPYDVAEALDAIGDEVLAGGTPTDALRRLMREGANGLRGLDDLRRQAQRRRRQLRKSGELDGTLEEVRRLLEQALEAERRELFADPSDDARLEEAELDTLPDETASAVRALADRQWRSAAAREAYEQITELLRSEVLDSQFAGMRDALRGADAEDMRRVKDMMSDLNDLLDKHARGEDTEQALSDFLDKHGDFFPEKPSTVDELIDQLARRAAAAQRMMAGLTPQQRAELSDLMSNALGGDLDLAAQLDRLNAQLQAARPDLDWNSDPRMSGRGELGMSDATAAIAELSDLEALERGFSQSYAGASLDDIDPEQVARALGRSAVDDLQALRRIERELTRQGWLTRRDGRLELSPRALRRLGATALKRVFADLASTGRGQHDVTGSGIAGEPTGASVPWEFGDTRPLDAARTVRNAVVRSGPSSKISLDVEDFEVVETERRTRAAVALLVDLSYSMALNGTWAPAKQTALALHSLVTTRFPQDSIEIIGFSQYARTLKPTDLAGLDFDPVQGTNLQHALMLARRHLTKHSGAEPVVMVVTDGEPTAHLERDGSAVFCWPPLPETLELTMAEVDRATRAGVTLNMFMLGDDPRLVEFCGELTRRNGGRLFTSDGSDLGAYVVRDYLRRRTGTPSGRRAS
ncbi:vWA domain-containing protein [Fodinicola acaciae]|uniref:vWA domain-containing protein n=1 Tax=Fodinicola acaciae TaxID=2681555 RepID=UPI0013CFF999|nr:hypothetical protein [Fodinicola acaciae]